MKTNLIVLFVLLSATITLCRKRIDDDEVLNLRGSYGMHPADALKKNIFGLESFQRREFFIFALVASESVPAALVLPKLIEYMIRSQRRKTPNSDILLFVRLLVSHKNKDYRKLRNNEKKNENKNKNKHKADNKAGTVYISNWDPYGLNPQDVAVDDLKQILEGLGSFKRGSCPFSGENCDGASAKDILSKLVANIIINKAEKGKDQKVSPA